MSTLESGLYSHLSTDSDILDIVSKRIYPVIAPSRAALPYITYSRISGERVTIMGSISGEANPRIQINCWAKTYVEVKNLAEKVRLSLDSFSGTMGNVTVDAVINEGDNDIMNYDAENEHSRIYGVALDFEIWHKEATS